MQARSAIQHLFSHLPHAPLTSQHLTHDASDLYRNWVVLPHVIHMTHVASLLASCCVHLPVLCSTSVYTAVLSDIELTLLIPAGVGVQRQVCFGRLLTNGVYQ